MHQCIKSIYFRMALYMFRTVFPPIIRSSRLYVKQPNTYCCLLASNKQTAVSVWQMSVAVCTVLNSWRWMERPSETCRVPLVLFTFRTCCILRCLVCIVVVVLCVLLSSYVYLLYCVCIAVFTLDARLLARSQYSEGPASGHLDTGFSWVLCVYKQMLRWFPRFQVATTCF